MLAYGLAAATATSAGPYSPATKVTVAAVEGGLLVLDGVLIGIGMARSPVLHRLFWYRDGLVQVVDGEPEPRVMRWADVETVIVYGHDDGYYIDLIEAYESGEPVTVSG